MALQLTIIKFPPGISLPDDSKTMGPQGLRIGRGADNDWVLSDPERFLSSKHCKLSKDAGKFFLTDLSTNGTFVNGAAEPLGRGQKQALKDGDSFDVGDYRFKVSMTQGGGGFPEDPFGDSQLKPPKGFADGGFADANNKPQINSGEAQNIASGLTPNEMRENDPLYMFDQMQSGGNSRPPNSESNNFNDPIGIVDDQGGHRGDKPFGRESVGDADSHYGDAIKWPEAQPDADSGLLPEDWNRDPSIFRGGVKGGQFGIDDKNSTGGSPPPSGDTPPFGDTGVNKSTGTAGATGKSNRRDEVQSNDLIGGAPFGGRRQNPRQPGAEGKNVSNRQVTSDQGTGTHKATGQQGTLGKSSSQSKTQANTGSSSTTSSTSNRPQSKPPHAQCAADRSMVDALGLDGVELSDAQIREINATVGAMMRETLDGLMQILRSRASIKNEFRINITTIQPVENNPIKFSANVDEIIELMFLKRSNAYKAPMDALQESFNTIADHQLAVIAGIRSAFRSSLNKFDPLVLEDEFKQKGKGGMLPGILKGSLWGAYQEHYQGMVNDVERSFQDLFGNEFVQAYEEQLIKLAQARKRDV